MKRIARVVLAVVLTAMFVSMSTRPASAAEVKGDRVVAMYFHRTQRCPTCLKMGSYSEEAVKSAFAEEIENGTVAFYYVDFQNKKNAALTKGYRVTGPALIVAKIAGNKVVEFKNLKDIWTKVGDKKAFLKYVQNGVTAYAKGQAIARR
jgi:thiol-disulfide isomerase/thioredoxin